MGSCPKELKLNKENSDKLEGLFLDLQIEIENGKFMLGLFDKRDNFPFSIVRMPYKSSNLPSTPCSTLQQEQGRYALQKQ